MQDGDLIRIDGFKGEVLLLSEENREGEGGIQDGNRSAGQ
jgi:hypothetical protein